MAAKSDQTVRMATPEQLKQVWAIVMQALPTRITWAQAQYWIGHGKELATKIHNLFKVVDPYADQIRSWESFYRDALGLTVDFSQVQIPAQRDGFTRLIIVAKDLTIEQVLTACKKHFKVWRWTNDNLDQIVTVNDRSASNGAYAIWLRDRQEPDEEHKNKSADTLKTQGIQGVTLLEELVNHLEYFTRTGKHQSIQNWTLCSHSRYSDGGVPYVSWGGCGDELRVYWCRPGHAYGGLRSREAVS